MIYKLLLLLLLLLSRFSRVRLCATSETAAHQAPLSLGFSREEHWSGLPFPSPMHESEKWKWSRSVVSDSSRPHGLQPTMLLRPWDFPGKSTGVGCHCLLLPHYSYFLFVGFATLFKNKLKFYSQICIHFLIEWYLCSLVLVFFLDTSLKLKWKLCIFQNYHFPDFKFEWS